MSSVDTSWMSELGSRFLVFEGPDGSGKSTQQRLFVDQVREAGVVVREVREPGGTAIGEHVRKILLDPELSEMGVRCELMLYMASRAQLVEQEITPALDRGELVVSDRYVSSTLAYQGTAGGLTSEEILRVAESACGPMPTGEQSGGVWPDLTLVFDVDEQTAARRLNPLLDRMEQKGSGFHRRVRAGYLDQAERWPDRYTVIDATRPIEEVACDVKNIVRERLGA
ncbi:MAG: dTMP kinase [Planctomycetota bacterium]